MTTHELQWLAGIVDSEGSFDMRKSKSSFTYGLRIATIDNVIIPTAAKILNVNILFKQPSGHAKSIAQLISLSTIKCRWLLPQIMRYLYTKKAPAECVWQAMSIADGVSRPYTDDERELWWSLKKQLASYNAVGKLRTVRPGPADHKFSWAWLAGFIDGDGSVHLAKFKVGDRLITKPVLTISSSHIATIEYISQRLGCSNNNAGNRGNRSPHRKLRLTSNKIMEIGPYILPFLTLKQEKLRKAMEIIETRRKLDFTAANELILSWV